MKEAKAHMWQQFKQRVKRLHEWLSATPDPHEAALWDLASMLISLLAIIIAIVAILLKR